MPLDEKLLGFSNHWYKEAMAAAEPTALPSGQRIRLISPPYFIVTKLDAFHGRGKGDFYSSHDLEDIITVLDGRPELLEEVRIADDGVRKYIGEHCKNLVENPRFQDALPGYLLPDAASQGRFSKLLACLTDLVRLG
jgi:hypothetical protein